MFGKESLRLRAEFIREQGDAAEVFFAGELDGMCQQPTAVTHATMLRMDDDILHQNDQPAFRGADGEEQIHHADHHVVCAQDENAASVRLFQDQPQTMLLFVFVRPEVRLFAEKRHQQLDELWHVFNGCRLDTRLGSEAGHWTQFSQRPGNRNQVNGAEMNQKS